MTLVLRKAIETITTVTAAVASCYLGLLLGRTLWDAPQLLLALFSDAEVSRLSIFGALPRVTVLPPPESSAFSFALFIAAPVIGRLSRTFKGGSFRGRQTSPLV